MSSHRSSPDLPFDRVAILGLGAMGGSLARALSALPSAPVVVGWSPGGEERAAALEAGAVSTAPGAWEAAVAGADLVVVAAPLEASCRLLQDLVGVAEPDATLSDVASLKAPVARAVREGGAEDRWVGSHPMTGSAASGFAASRTDLYAGARVWTVAHPEAEGRVEAVHALWRAVGARPESVDAAEHDRLMALASHLPQLVSNVLAAVLARNDVGPDRLGPGGADMTRLAGSSPGMWRDILAYASPDLAQGLEALAALSTGVAKALREGDLDTVEALMNETRAWSRTV